MNNLRVFNHSKYSWVTYRTYHSISLKRIQLISEFWVHLILIRVLYNL